MKEVCFLGKRTNPGSPKLQWPHCSLFGTTNSNQRYAHKRNKQGQVIGTVDDWDEWYDLHPFNPTPWYQGIKRLRPATYRWFQSLPGPTSPQYRPLWLFELDPTIPAGVQFPIQDVLDAFPILDGNGAFYTCQLDWMCGHVLLRGVEHLILHGHGVSQEPQHMAAHRGALYWIAVARERGVTVTVVPPSWYLAPTAAYGIAAGGWGMKR